MNLAHTPTSIHPVSVSNLMSTPKKLYTYGLYQNCHITQQNTRFIGRAGAIVLFEGPRAWKQRLTKTTRGNILTGNEILKALRRS